MLPPPYVGEGWGRGRSNSPSPNASSLPIPRPTQRRQYPLNHPVGIAQHLAIPEPQHPEALRPEPQVTSLVGGALLIVLTTIDLDHQPGLEAGEVRDVRPNRGLAPETRPELPATQP